MSRRTTAKIKQREEELAAKTKVTVVVTPKPTYPQEVDEAAVEAEQDNFKAIAAKPKRAAKKK